jgi:hypothetical protein
MLTRFRESGHPTIKAMMDRKNMTIPKHQNKPVCLVWALKGECSSNCKRKDMHIRCSATVNKAIHSMLDKCDVAALQGSVGLMPPTVGYPREASLGWPLSLRRSLALKLHQ